MNVIDIETFGDVKITPYCLCIKLNKDIKTFYGKDCVKDFINFCKYRVKSGTVFYAHNLTFDGLVLINNIPSNAELSNSGTKIIRGNIYSLTLNIEGTYIKFKCSYRILPLSLKTIAEKLCIDEKLEINHKKINEENYMQESIKSQVIEYCIRDVKICQTFINEINKNLSTTLWNWNSNLTISGIALEILKITIKIEINYKLDNIRNKKIRSAYYGGRCEVFGNPLEGDYIYHYDFIGMYTRMLYEEFPIDDGVYIENPRDIKIGFYFITVESTKFNIPILPYRDPISKKLLFPNGIFSGLYWHEEINLFTKNKGVLLKIEWGYEFNKMNKPFIEFAEFCIKKRKDNDTKLNNILWKLIPNSLTGRLGLNLDNSETIIINEDKYDPSNVASININCKRVILHKKINKTYLVKYEKIESRELSSGNVIFPAIITSKARILWWKTINTLILNKGRALYCDTDSIFIAYKKYILGEKHGEIKWDKNVKNTIVKRACFASSKCYSVEFENENNTKIKGIPKNIQEFNEFERNFYNNNLKSIKFDFFSKKNYQISILEITKKIDLQTYDKRLFTQNKKKTKPLIINIV